MKRIRIRNCLIFLAFITVSFILFLNGHVGFWPGFLFALPMLILFCEIYWMVTGKDVKGYILRYS